MNDQLSQQHDSITERWIISGTLVNQAPLLIGSGDSGVADITVLKDKNGIPFIPATSFTGVLRTFLREYVGDSEYLNSLEQQFWGYTDGEQGVQSAVVVKDLHPEDSASVTYAVRDGVAIDPSTRTALDQAKYNYEVVEPGVKFSFSMEVTSRKVHDREAFRKLVHTIGVVLKSGALTVGAKTSNGLGQVIAESVEITHYDFSDSEHTRAWLLGKQTTAMAPDAEEAYQLEFSRDFVMKVRLHIPHSVLVREYSVDPSQPDAVQFRSGNTPVIPGASFKGIIRHRALEILSILGCHDPEGKLAELFGFIADEGSARGHLMVKEAPIHHTRSAPQTRIQIDRFTGGVRTGALFDTLPEWNTGEDSYTELDLTISNYRHRKWAVGIMLQVVKDLWDHRLAAGGEQSIGRGRFRGISGEFRWDAQRVSLVQKEDGISFNPDGAAELLEEFNQALQSEVQS